MKKPVPKKKPTEPPDEQSRRFVADAQRMIDAGELNPIEGEKQLQNIASFSGLEAKKDQTPPRRSHQNLRTSSE